MRAYAARLHAKFRAQQAVFVLFGAYVIVRVFVVIVSRSDRHYDAFSYAHSSTPLFNRGPLVSFTGEAPRLWGTPLFYAILPNDVLRSVGQWGVSTLAWAVLAWALWQALRHTAAKVTAAGGVLCLAVLEPVTHWDFAILSESLSISLPILALGLLLLWLQKPPQQRSSVFLIIGATTALFWWTFTRPDIRLMTVIVVIVLVMVAWRDTARRVASLVAAGVLIGAIGWVSAITPSVSATFAGWSASGLEHPEENLTWRLNKRIYTDERVQRVYEAELGAPSCPAAKESAMRGDSYQTFLVAYRTCPSLHAWAYKNADSSTAKFILTAPDDYLRLLVRDLPAVLADRVSYANSPTVLPPVEAVAFPEKQQQVWALMAAGLAITGGALAVGAFRQHRVLTVSLGIVMVTALGSAIAGHMYGAYEFSRLGAQEAILLRICFIVFAAITLDCLLHRAKLSHRVPQSNLQSSSAFDLQRGRT
ncbi:MAG: hypothetical protein ACRDPW_04745 [Mycobacteriales bacterium]